jgi:hypothetical protein
MKLDLKDIGWNSVLWIHKYNKMRGFLYYLKIYEPLKNYLQLHF